jgi:hypothetical protein
MGGDKFDTPQPEAFLFGDCMDLNFLGSKPTPVSVCDFVKSIRSLQSVWLLMKLLDL